uniref:Uncharacterized protein n=1 Tax=viral metagenome TaxID=1070528 RepID=A0A6C0KJU8_9ZZZZ
MIFPFVKSTTIPCEPLHIPESISIFAVHMTAVPRFKQSRSTQFVFAMSQSTCCCFSTRDNPTHLSISSTDNPLPLSI